MTTADKIIPAILAYWLVMMLAFVILGGYGREAMECLLMKFYEFFVQRNPMNL